MALVSLAIVSHNRPEEEVMYMRDFSSDNALGRMSSLDDFEYDLFNLPPPKNIRATVANRHRYKGITRGTSVPFGTSFCCRRRSRSLTICCGGPLRNCSRLSAISTMARNMMDCTVWLSVFSAVPMTVGFMVRYLRYVCSLNRLYLYNRESD